MAENKNIEIVDLEYHHAFAVVRMVTLANGEAWELQGECNRCGDCCVNLKMPIPDLATKDGHCKFIGWSSLNGVKMCDCKITWCKPYHCAVYPVDPYDELYENCSYKWVRIK